MMRIAICDDDVKDAQMLYEYVSDYIKEHQLNANIHVYHTGEELLKSEYMFKIIFLDISMGEGIDGISVGKMFHSHNWNTKIIYTTNFEEFCEQAFNNVHAFAYLSKPICRDAVYQQLADALESEQYEKKLQVQFEVLEIIDGNSVEAVFKTFNVEDIYYFQCVNRRIKIKLLEGEFYFIESMKNVIAKMQKYGFESCHQSYLVNMRYVKKIKGYNLYMNNSEIIPISQKRSPYFREKMNCFIQNMYGE